MRLSISNIAWGAEADTEMYEWLFKENIPAVEIAPTRIFPETPYERLQEAGRYAEQLKDKYSLDISSMQSIWYGRKERVFGTEEERKRLADYTKKSVLFAAQTRCPNLVFGSPVNRSMPEGADKLIAVRFFREIAAYAENHGCVIAMEANPVIYNTNYINYTSEAFELAEEVAEAGFQVNVDLGTIIYNKEDIGILEKNMYKISHIHISEPGLEMIEKRSIHRELAGILRKSGYKGYISVEMKNQNAIEKVKEAVSYVKEVFG